MKPLACLIVAALVFIFMSTMPGYGADGGWHGGGSWHGGGDHHDGNAWHGSIWIGSGWGGWGPWWGPPYYPYYYPYYPETPVIIQQEPQTYVQPEEQYFWYYCRKPEGYYPYVKECPGGWLKVVPPTPPEDEE